VTSLSNGKGSNQGATLDAYMCEFFPEVDLGAVSYWDIGKLNPIQYFMEQ
jgi:hypothetical protein